MLETHRPARRRRRRLLVQFLTAACVGTVGLAASAVTGLAAEPTVEVTGSTPANFAWTPTNTEIEHGSSVMFKNGTGNLHALAWESGPETPSCTGTPSAGQANWSGSCTFAQGGTYHFYCPVHPSTMKGTVTVSGPAAPVVSTGSASAVAESEATLNGTVNPSGQATTYYFEYGTTASYGLKTTEESAGAGSTAADESATVSGLSAATTYHFRIVAKSAGGTAPGADHTFSTVGAPAATTEAATKVGGTEATLPGSVNPHGLATSYFFNYGTTGAYGQKTSETAAGSGTTAASVSTLLSGLTPETTYHFQIVAKNSGGTVEGGDRTFTTLGRPVATTGAAAGVAEGTATLQGTVNPQGQQTTYFFKYGTTTAYGQETAPQSAGKGLADVSASTAIADLLPGTTYHFQLVAQNGSGSAAGTDQTFTTASPSLQPPPSSGSPGPTPVPPPPPSPAPAPDTRLVSKPRAKTKDRTPTVKFTGSAAGSTFRCSVDSRPFKTCRSPFTSPSLKPGRHTIRVAAVAGGVTDPTPASCSFKVVGKPASRRH